MPNFEHKGAHIFYEDVGDGPLVITMHGMMSPGYWTIAGVSGCLGLNHRVASIDMRGHGRTVTPIENEGFDAETIAGDIGALADHLGVKKFHLVGHATGGMAAIRYAMQHHDRLLSLIAMDTSPETAPLPHEVFLKQADVIASTPRDELFSSMRDSHAGVFLQRLETMAHAKQAVAQVSTMFEANDPVTLGRFMRAFFSDSDPHIDRLKAITCPVLSVVGEFDPPFVPSAQLLADTIPNAVMRPLLGIGHMTAFEDSYLTFKTIKDFLDARQTQA